MASPGASATAAAVLTASATAVTALFGSRRWGPSQPSFRRTVAGGPVSCLGLAMAYDRFSQPGPQLRRPCSSLACAERGKNHISLRFAAIADIQYANIESRRNRNYRESLDVTQRAVEFFNTHAKAGSSTDRGLDFFVHAGDLVDFYNTEGPFATDGGRETALAMGAVMEQLSKVIAPHSLYLIGNHELYNWPREALLSGVPWQGGNDGSSSSSGRVHFCPSGQQNFWHSFCPQPGWRCVVLDPYDVSIYRKGRILDRAAPNNYDLDQESVQLLCDKNENIRKYVAKHPGENILLNYWEGIEPHDLRGRWSPVNGGIGKEQLQWLEDELKSSYARGEKVIVFTHVLVHPQTSDGKTLIWNFDEVLGLLQSEIGSTVQLVISGHRHSGGFHTDELGIHYVVMESPLNTQPHEMGSFFLVEADDENLNLIGYGNANSVIFPKGSPAHPGDAPARRRLPLRRGPAQATPSL